jgi:uncharacterized protein (TIGR02466 family)
MLPITTAPVYEFNINKELVSTLILDISQIKSNYNGTNILKHVTDAELNYSYYNAELFALLEGFLAEIAKDNYEEHVKLSITECWGVISNKFQRHHRHSHPNSILSGIIYLTDSEAETEFYLDNPWTWANSVLMMAKEGSNKVLVKVKPVAGKVIVFPSNIEHGTAANLSNDKRITISFNTYPSCILGKKSTYLDITSKSVKDAYKSNLQ